MSHLHSNQHGTELDAIVVGTGFGGIYMLHKLRNELGLTVRSFERGSGIGGTWYWNRYPGAMSDTESTVYRYSFDRETPWKTRYVEQPDILAYLEGVVERYDLAKDIQLDTTVESAVYDEAGARWTVTTDAGETFTARYLVTALGPLSTTNFPEFKGREKFKGRLVHTGAWPKDLGVEGKRVGVIGTGSTGTQFICAASKTAEHLTVFQRTPQYVVPSGNGPVSEQQLADYRAGFDTFWEQVRSSRIACGFTESSVPAMSVTEEERHRVFQESWDKGNGFRFMFGTFGDIASDPEANRAAGDFIRSKIAEIVHDPETARKLMPTDLYAKRPICNQGYYEAYNRENVSLVSVKENPITELTENGVVTADGVEHELDLLVCATGFDAVTGSYEQVDIRGRSGELLRDRWAGGASSYLGMAVSGFPNLFMVLGPNSVFSNLPPGIETQVEWISDLIGAAEADRTHAIEPTEESEQAWSATCQEIADHTLFPKVASWIFGANIPGKANRAMFYFGGLAEYRRTLAEVADSGYDGFVRQQEERLHTV